jgi:HTH-type transcriptional regulator/antitoxin HigA
MKLIKTKKEYYSVMAKIETFLEKGFKNLTKIENEELRLLSLQIEAFEKVHFPMPVQHDLTTLLEVDDSTLNSILSKKKPLTLNFAKMLHQKIHLDGNLILEMV